MEIRSRRYLNNIVEQDHRAIKRRCASMLGLKSFNTAAITLAGIELAHRIRKRQFSLNCNGLGGPRSLKEVWDTALSSERRRVTRESELFSPMHQISTGARRPKSATRRYPRKVAYGRSLYMLVMPRGGRYWRYCYRYRGKQKMLALGVYPDVPLESAKARQQAARQLLAAGIDPAIRRNDLRCIDATREQLALDHCSYGDSSRH